MWVAGIAKIVGALTFTSLAGTGQRLTQSDANGVQSASNGLADGQDISFGTSTGTKLGTATSQKFALWNKTPIIQPAHGSQAAVAAATQDTLTDSTTGTADTTVADVGAAFNQGTLNNNFADIVAQLAKIKADIVAIKTFQDQNRTDQIAVGVIKGSA